MTAFEEKYLKMAKEIVLKHIPTDEYAVFLFGSRAEGSSNKFSDIDIGILGVKEFPDKIKWEIKDELDESAVPYDVDIVDFKKTREEFRKIALHKIELWNYPNHLKENLKSLISN